MLSYVVLLVSWARDRTRLRAEWSAPCVKSDLPRIQTFTLLRVFFYRNQESKRRHCLVYGRLNAAMTREEDLIRIAKKLDKMVSRNNTVRLYFDTHRWRAAEKARPWLSWKRHPFCVLWTFFWLCAFEKVLHICVIRAWLHCNKWSTGVWRIFPPWLDVSASQCAANICLLVEWVLQIFSGRSYRTVKCAT